MLKVVVDPQNLPGMSLLRLPADIAVAAYMVTVGALAEAGVVVFAQTEQRALPAGFGGKADKDADVKGGAQAFGFAGGPVLPDVPSDPEAVEGL